MAVALAVPWLNPFTAGPSVSLWQWITTGLVTSGAFVSVGLYQRTIDVAYVVRIFIYSWLIAGVVSSCIGVVQYFGWAHYFAPWMNVSTLGEGYANLRQRNQFASLTNIALLALLWVMSLQPPALETQPDPYSPTKRIALGVVLAVVLGVGNAVSSSRIGLVQLLFVTVISAWWAYRGKTQAWPHGSPQWALAFPLVLVLAVLTYLLASWAFPMLLGLQGTTGSVLARLQDSTIACTSRLVLWSNVWDLILARPWTGWGWGELDYAHFMAEYRGPRFCEILDNAHNLPLHIAVELGLPVAILAVVGFCLWVWKQRPLQERNPTRQLAWAVLGVIGLHSMVEYPLWYGPFQMAALACVVVLVAGSAGQENAMRVRVHSAIQGRVVLAGSLIVLTLFAWVGWEYWRVSQLYMAPADRHPAYRENTLKAVGTSWLFSDQLEFAELGMSPLTRANAEHINALAKKMLHFSPEPRVAEAVIDSALLLGNDGEAAFYLQRLQWAFPGDANAWLKASKAASQP